MRAKELFKGFRIYTAVVKVKNPGYTELVDASVFAKNVNMAKMLFQQQYGKQSVVSNVKEVKK